MPNNPVSPINTNSRDLPVYATLAGGVVMPRATPGVNSTGLNYQVGAQVVGAVSPTGADAPLQADLGGALATMGEEMAWADAGAYFRAGQAPGTASAYSVTTAYSATKAFLALVAASGSKRVYPDYIKLLCTVAPASATSGHLAIQVDPTNRYTSGGTAIAAADESTLSSNAAAPLAAVYVGAPTIAAAGADSRIVARHQVRSVIPVVGDTYIIQFGMPPLGSGFVINGTSPQVMTFPVPPVVLAPTASLLLSLWFPANAVTPPQFEVEIGWAER